MPNANYMITYSGTEVDLQYRADQATTFTMTTGTVTRALVNTTVALSGSITNASPAGSANLAVSLSSGGTLNVTGLTSGTSSLAPQTSTSVAGTIQAGAVAGSQGGTSNVLFDGATPSLKSLVFSNTTGSYALDQGSGGSLTLASASGMPTIDVATNALADIKTAILGSAGLQKLGDGTLVLSGSSSFTGGTDLGGGRTFQIDTSTLGQVNIIVVPEPGAIALAGIGAAAAAWVTAKRRRRHTP